MTKRYEPADRRVLGRQLTDDERIEIEDRLNGTAEGDFLAVTPEEEQEWERIERELSRRKGGKLTCL